MRRTPTRSRRTMPTSSRRRGACGVSWEHSARAKHTGAVFAHHPVRLWGSLFPTGVPRAVWARMRSVATSAR
jgi:hypothetical protein